MWRKAGLAALALIVGLGIMVAFTSPPALLSLVDGVMGGGQGAVRSGSAIPFGTHGQSLDVWRPAGASAAKRPVVVFWYGGGWVKGDRRAYSFAARAYA
ncbi:MAG: alpha/beta hydrolase, partial [Sphingomonadales bacterium]